MNAEQAKTILAYRDRQLRFVPTITDMEGTMRAEILAAALGDAPADWATKFVVEQSVAGRVPTDADIIAGWREHVADIARERLRGPIPVAPREVTEDGARWVQWERARRRAIVAGATPDEAIGSANEFVGASPDPDPGPVDVDAIRAQIRALGAKHRMGGAA